MHNKISVGSLVQYESINGTRYTYIVKAIGINGVALKVETLDKRMAQTINKREFGDPLSGWTLINAAG